MDWFLALAEEDQEFIKQLVLSSGSLKELAKIYQVSYQTVRVRLNNIIAKVKLFDDQKKGSFETEIMQLVIDEKLSLDVAKTIIKKYQEDTRE